MFLMNIEYYPNSENIKSQEEILDDGTRIIRMFHRDGDIYMEKRFYENGDDPMEYRVTFSQNGNIIKEEWRMYYVLHNTVDPARIMYNSDGNIMREEWYINGKLHNENGPASIKNNLIMAN